jgi:hypothetical protein
VRIIGLLKKADGPVLSDRLVTNVDLPSTELVGKTMKRLEAGGPHGEQRVVRRPKALQFFQSFMELLVGFRGLVERNPAGLVIAVGSFATAQKGAAEEEPAGL